MRRALTRLTLALFGVCLALLLAEGALRLLGPRLGLETERTFRLDPDLGFQEEDTVPVYENHRRNLAAPPELPRVFFLGDSVTNRGMITLELARLYGDQRHEFINGGQDGFSAVQLVRLYLKYLRDTRIEHIVFLFHNNDFQENHVCFQRPFSDHPSLLDTEAWHFSTPLFLHSHLYRVLLGKPGVCSFNPITREQWARVRAAVRRELGRLKARQQGRGARLTLVLLPAFHLGPWPPDAMESRSYALQLFRELGLRHVDLRGVYLQALKDGVDIQEHPGDVLHPSRELGRRMARFLKEARLLDP